MRALGLLLLLVGCLFLLWPVYDELVPVLRFTRSETQVYGGLTLLAGVVALFIARARAG